jgi:hypothetical protein
LFRNDLVEILAFLYFWLDPKVPKDQGFIKISCFLQVGFPTQYKPLPRTGLPLLLYCLLMPPSGILPLKTSEIFMRPRSDQPQCVSWPWFLLFFLSLKGFAYSVVAQRGISSNSKATLNSFFSFSLMKKKQKIKKKRTYPPTRPSHARRFFGPPHFAEWYICKFLFQRAV